MSADLYLKPTNIYFLFSNFAPSNFLNMMTTKGYHALPLALCFIFTTLSLAHLDDFAALDAFRKGLTNSHLLRWPAVGDNPCVKPDWEHISCHGGRVTSISAAKLGLNGTLPSNFNLLTELHNVSLQHNNLHGPLPTFRGMARLQNIFLGWNQFDSIPSDFFRGLNNLQTVSIGRNPLNVSGWTIPGDLQSSSNLTALKMTGCNLVGELPGFLGKFKNLVELELGHNNLTGPLPATLSQSKVQILSLNNQKGSGLNGSIDVIHSMVALKQVWLHGNKFTSRIPEGLDALQGLTELNLSGNNLTGIVPVGLTKLKQLRLLDLSENDLSPPLPKFAPSVQVDVHGNPKFKK